MYAADCFHATWSHFHLDLGFRGAPTAEFLVICEMKFIYYNQSAFEFAQDSGIPSKDVSTLFSILFIFQDVNISQSHMVHTMSTTITACHLHPSMPKGVCYSTLQTFVLPMATAFIVVFLACLARYESLSSLGLSW